MQDIIMPEPGSIIWTLCVFVVLLFVLRKWAWGPIVQALQAREDNIKKDIDEAQKARQEAEELLDKYKKQMDEASREVQQRIKEANERASVLYEQRKQEIDLELQSLRDKTRNEIDLERQKAVQELREEVIEIAITAAGKVIGQALREDDHRALIQREIEKLN